MPNNPITAPGRHRAEEQGRLAAVHPAGLSAAADEARHVGEIVAMVVAETLAAAKDAAELVVVDYEPLPA